MKHVGRFITAGQPNWNYLSSENLKIIKVFDHFIEVIIYFFWILAYISHSLLLYFND